MIDGERVIEVVPATKGAFDSLSLSILELQLDNQSMHPAFPVVLGPIRQSDPWQAASKAAISPAYLPHISPHLLLYLPYISPTSPLYLPYISPIYPQGGRGARAHAA